MKRKIAIYANGWGANNLATFLKGIENAFSVNDIDVDFFTFMSFSFFADGEDNTLGEASIYELADVKKFDGAIIFSNGLNDPDMAQLIAEKYVSAGIPVVSLGIKIPGASYVSTNASGMRVLADHLINEHGVRNVTFFAGNEGNEESDQRMQAMEEALAKVGEKIHDVVYTNWGTDYTINYIDAHYTSKDKLPDALVCANDYIALAACFRLHKLGIRVPDDVIVTGFDGIKEGKTFFPSLTTVCQDYFELGKACGQIVLNQVEAGVVEPCDRLIDTVFLPGESCGCSDKRDSRSDRDEACREYYSERTERVFFNYHLNGMESTLYSCDNLANLGKVMTYFFAGDHSYEGPNFWIVGERSYGASIYNDEVKMRRNTFSDKLDVWTAIEDGEPLFFDSIHKSELIPGYREKSGKHNYVFIPIHVGDILYAYLVLEGCYNAIEDFSLEVYRRAVRNALDKHRQNMKLEYLNKKLMELYTRDSLTGLYNRFGYECLAVPMFKNAKINGITCAIIFMDINRMKYINDNFGHLQGDLAIRTIANAISLVTPPSWISIRYGGDEYLIIGECVDEAEVKALVNKLDEAVRRQVSRMLLPYSLTASCGYIMTDPNSSYTLSEYVQKADDVMYENKKLAHEKDMLITQ